MLRVYKNVCENGTDQIVTENHLKMVEKLLSIASIQGFFHWNVHHSKVGSGRAVGIKVTRCLPETRVITLQMEPGGYRRIFSSISPIEKEKCMQTVYKRLIEITKGKYFLPEVE